MVDGDGTARKPGGLRCGLGDAVDTPQADPKGSWVGQVRDGCRRVAFIAVWVVCGAFSLLLLSALQRGAEHWPLLHRLLLFIGVSALYVFLLFFGLWLLASLACVRFSLHTLMLAVLAAGACIAVFAGDFNPALKISAVFGLAGVLGCILYGVLSFDPCPARAGGRTPPDRARGTTPPWRGRVPPSWEGTEQPNAGDRRESGTEGRQG